MRRLTFEKVTFLTNFEYFWLVYWCFLPNLHLFFKFFIIFRILGSFCEAFEFLISNLFLWSLSTLCGALLTMKMELVEYILWFAFFQYIIFSHFTFSHAHQMDTNANPLELIQIACTIFWAIMMIFIACEFGEMVSSRFEKIDRKLCHCRWYLFPLKMRRIYAIVMTNTQQPLIVQGYANTQCTRGSFNRVQENERENLNKISFIFFSKYFIVIFVDNTGQFLLLFDAWRFRRHPIIKYDPPIWPK